jgi:hypothetical protein
MSDATVNLGGWNFTLTNAVQDTTNGYVDVYNESTLYALRSAIKNGDDLNNISTQVQQYGNDLKQVNSLSSWQASDWSDPATAVQRTQALVDLGVLQSPSPPQAVNDAQANIIFVTTASTNSGIAPDTQLPYGHVLQTVNYPGDGLDTGYAGSTPAIAARSDTNGVFTWFVIDTNKLAWKIDTPFATPTTSKLAYMPTDTEISGYQPNRQSWVTSLGQMSQDSQLILQSTTALYTQSLDAASNIQQGKAQSKAGVANNFA